MKYKDDIKLMEAYTNILEGKEIDNLTKEIEEYKEKLKETESKKDFGVSGEKGKENHIKNLNQIIKDKMNKRAELMKKDDSK